METSKSSSIELCDIERASINIDTGNDFSNFNDATALTATDMFVLRTLVYPFKIFGTLNDADKAPIGIDTCNDTGNDVGNVKNTMAQSTTGGTFVIRMWVQPFTIFCRYISPSQYQTKLPPSLQKQNQDNCVDNYQLQEWIHIWKRIKNVKYKHPGYPAIIAMLYRGTILIIYVFFAINIEVYREGFLVMYCIAVTLLNVYCYVKHSDGNRVILLHWRTILAITLSANVVAYFAIVETLQRNKWQWYYWYLMLLAITMTPIGCIHLCIPPINAYCRYFALHDQVLRKIYYEILTINNEITFFTLRPKVGFHVSNITVDVYIRTSKQENGIHQLSSSASPLTSTTITTTIDVLKLPNCSDDSFISLLL
jgi:hypothetical protein